MKTRLTDLKNKTSPKNKKQNVTPSLIIKVEHKFKKKKS